MRIKTTTTQYLSGLMKRVCLNRHFQNVRLHGEENAEYIDKLRENCDCEIWKAVRAKCADDIAKADALPVHKLLIDSFSAGSYGGTGKRVDQSVKKRLKFLVFLEISIFV